MADEQFSEEQRLGELRDTAEAMAKLAEEETAFTRTVEAFRAEDAGRFQEELSKLGLLPRCRLICRFLCSKHCVFVCFRLCKEPPRIEQQFPIKEVREFSLVTARIAKDDALLKRFIDAVDRVDEETFSELVRQHKLQRFCHQLCHWLCHLRCRLVCERMCPPPPIITKVGLIPTGQIDPQGRAAGPSSPPGTTPSADPPSGIGDHPFGGLANIRGVFSIAGPFEYKVEFAMAPGGPWTPIIQPISDFRWNPLWMLPGQPLFLDYIRNATAPDGWYRVDEIGLAGFDYLTDWPTPSGPDKLYYLKLTVRNTALAEFQSNVVPVRVDNVQPAQPVIQLELQTPNGSRRQLGCCEEVERGDGNLVVITLTAWDHNFSRVNVTLMGGCGSGVPIVDTGGTPLSKTYNGNTADKGYPTPATFLWDPWAAGVDPCCYLVHVRIWDRAIVNNHWAGGHTNVNWHSITIA